MTDHALRQRERAWRASGTVEAERAYRRAQLRAGVLDARGLEAITALHAQVRSYDGRTFDRLADRCDGLVTRVDEAGARSSQRIVRATSSSALEHLLGDQDGMWVSRVEVRSRLVARGEGRFEGWGCPWKTVSEGAWVRLAVRAGDDLTNTIVRAGHPQIEAEVAQVLRRREQAIVPVSGLRVEVLDGQRGDAPWLHVGWAVDNALARALELLDWKVLEPWVEVSLANLTACDDVARWIYRRGGWVTWREERGLRATLPLRRVRKLRRQLRGWEERDVVLTWEVLEERPTPRWLGSELLQARWRFPKRDDEQQAKPSFDVDA